MFFESSGYSKLIVIVYIIKNNFGKLYTGVSENSKNRLKEHNAKRGSIFTKSGNFKIVFREEYKTLAEARRRETQIKKWRREKKEKLFERYKKELPTKKTWYLAIALARAGSLNMK